FGESLGQGMEALKQQRVKSLAAARPTDAGTLAGSVGGAVLADKALGEEHDAYTRLAAATGGMLLGGAAGHFLHGALNQRRTKYLLRPGARRREMMEAYRYAPPGHTPDSVLRAQANHPRIARRPSKYELVERGVTGAFGAGLPVAYAYSGWTGEDMDPVTTAALMAAGGVGLPVARMVRKPLKISQPPLRATLAGEGALQVAGQFPRAV